MIKAVLHSYQVFILTLGYLITFDALMANQ